MTLSRRTLGAFALASLVALPLIGCGEALPSYRYRLTVEVDTPQGLKTGSSVIEVSARYNGKGFPGPEAGGTPKSARGEAVAVDIAPGQTLFALLTGGASGSLWTIGVMRDMVSRASPSEFKAMKDPQPEAEALLISRIHALKGARPVPRTVTEPSGQSVDNYPLLVRFKNIADPKSVERVDPAALDKAFGPGVKLKRITVQVTDDAVTSGIEGRLGWLGKQRGSLDYTGKLHPNNPEKDITTSAFIQGTLK